MDQSSGQRNLFTWWFDVESRVRRVISLGQSLNFDDVCFKPTGEVVLGAVIHQECLFSSVEWTKALVKEIFLLGGCRLVV
jgi:hypothetical protein